MCIELGRTIGIGALHFNHTQIMIPFCLRLILYLLEIPFCIFGFQIFTCIFYWNIRNSNLILNILLFVYIKSKVYTRILTFCKSCIWHQFFSLPCTGFKSISIKLCYKIDFIRSTEPTEISSFCITFTLIRGSNNNCSLFNRSCRNTSTNDYCTILLICRIFITSHPRSLGHCQFCLDILLHHSLIITGMSFFFRYIYTIVEDVIRWHFQFSLHRESGKISHMFTTTTTQLIDNESRPFGKIRWSKLYHPIRISCSRIKISGSQSGTFCSNQRIDLMDIVTSHSLCCNHSF